ncbi:hypothetical protein AB0D14_35950 [Streptomyces sp. NPDC048484]|uniref:hypothetical protein n=1 Tax=Streptomyces sp. NPDC048484 TaxID=3155146 RepID=UPI00342F3C76
MAKVLIGEGGELTEKSAQQLVLEDLDRIMEVLPPLAERDFMEADRLESAAKESAQGAKEHRVRGNRILALFKRYDRLVVGIDSIPGIFTSPTTLPRSEPRPWAWTTKTPSFSGTRAPCDRVHVAQRSQELGRGHRDPTRQPQSRLHAALRQAGRNPGPSACSG